MLDPKAARTWYRLGMMFSVVAVMMALLSHVAPRIGYPLGFLCTVLGVLAVTLPSWPARRLRLVIINAGVVVSQLAVLMSAINAAQA